ncbi:MAG: 16S rRNA (cytosine(967)-C(5))-methyltransferase RsmB [Pseudomonadota bacterium]
MDTVQRGASMVVAQVMGGHNLNQGLSEFLLSKPGMALSTQQRGALQDLSYGTLRHYGQLMCVLRQLLRKPLQDEQLRCLLLVALYQLEYSKAAPYAVVDHAVRAVRKRNPAAGGLVNAVLRNFLRGRDALLAAAAATDEGRYAYPQWWIDKVRAQYGDRADGILLAGNQHPPMTLRVNHRRISPADYLALLAQRDINARLIKPEAILLTHPLPVEQLPGFADGLVSVQDAGAQYAAPLLDVRDGMYVLDACAAPGGKSTHLLELAQIELLALDKDARRLDRVRSNLRRLNFDAQLLQGDAAQPDSWWDGRPFQRILADVPCSASGVVRRHPDIKWLRRSTDIAGFAQQQREILTALWRLLARDGKLLYVTCSVFAQENQLVIGEFLHQQQDARQLPLPMPFLYAGFDLNARSSLNDYSILDEGQLSPDDQHDGFFYALLHKHA